MLFYIIGVVLALGLVLYDMYVKNPTGRPTNSVDTSIEIMLITLGSIFSWFTVMILFWSFYVQYKAKEEGSKEIPDVE